MAQEHLIALTKLRMSIYLGWYEAEREFPQVIELDLFLSVKNDAVGREDTLDGTVDYAAVVEKVREFLCSRRWKVVEYLNSELCNLLLQEWPLLDKVEVRLRKFALAEIEAAEFRFSRSR